MYSVYENSKLFNIMEASVWDSNSMFGWVLDSNLESDSVFVVFVLLDVLLLLRD